MWFWLSLEHNIPCLVLYYCGCRLGVALCSQVVCSEPMCAPVFVPASYHHCWDPFGTGVMFVSHQSRKLDHRVVSEQPTQVSASVRGATPPQVASGRKRNPQCEEWLYGGSQHDQDRWTAVSWDIGALKCVCRTRMYLIPHSCLMESCSRCVRGK